MLARRLSGILPPLSFDESIEATTIHSVAGQLRPGVGLLTERPFRAPHHTISDVALVGGGGTPRPGEVSLAHHGVLFLDEMPEFDRRVLEALRQPIEEGRITVSRALRSVVFPARFVLVAAMNPCPCGYLGDKRARVPLHAATDGALSRPTLGPVARSDRPDRRSRCRSDHRIDRRTAGEPSASVRQRVLAARERQASRSIRARVNAQLTGTELKRVAPLDQAGRRLLERSAARLHMSARAFHRVIRVARTIADLAERRHRHHRRIWARRCSIDSWRNRPERSSDYRDGVTDKTVSGRPPQAHAATILERKTRPGEQIDNGSGA